MSQNYFIKLWELSYKINSLIKEIGYWEYCKKHAVLPTFGRISQCELVPFVLIRDNQYYFGTTERGSIFAEPFSTDYRDVIYWFFNTWVALPAGLNFGRLEYEKYETNININIKRFYCKKILEILYKVGFEYGERGKYETNEMIKKHPFNDGFPETLDFLDQYLATHAPVNTDIDTPVNTSVFKRICSKFFKFFPR